MNNIIEITDFNAPELDVYARLSEAQVRTIFEPAIGLFIAESPIVIDRALDAGYVPVSLLMERSHVEGQAKNIIKRCGNIPVFVSDSDVLANITGFQLTRGVLCAMYRKENRDINDICMNSKRLVVLENVMNPTNVGAIIRSAAALGMDGVLLTPGCSDPLYRRAVRVSMGTVFQIPWAQIGEKMTDWPTNGIEYLHSIGYKCVAMALDDNSIGIDDEVLQSIDKLAIVMGTEGDGLAQSTIADCDYTVKIPMYHGVDSLNVAAASAVAFWQLRNK